jgi:hypothetical protein
LEHLMSDTMNEQNERGADHIDELERELERVREQAADLARRVLALEQLHKPQQPAPKKRPRRGSIEHGMEIMGTREWWL